MAKAGADLVSQAAKKKGRPPGRMNGITQRNILHVQRMFQEHGQEALDTMLSIMRDDEADHSVRLKAATECLNRGFGTPVSTQIMISLDESDKGSPVNPAQIGRASTDELQAVLATLQNFLESESKMVDVTPSGNDYENNS